MKTTASASTLILALIFSAEATSQLSSVVTTNPYTGIPFLPSEPNTDQPIVIVQSPNNTTYHENQFPLNFTVTKPDSCLQSPYNISCWIKDVKYEIDGQMLLYEPSPSLHELPVTKQFSTVLTGVSEGQHTLQVQISAERQYDPNHRSYVFEMKRYSLNVSQTIKFTEDEVDYVPAFPSWKILPLVAATTLIAIYFKKKIFNPKLMKSRLSRRRINHAEGFFHVFPQG